MMKIFANPKAAVKSKYGQYQIAVLNNIIAVSAEGVASKESIERYVQDISEIVLNMEQKPWAFLGFLHGTALLTKDAEKDLHKSVLWRVSRGMTTSALVTQNTTIEAMVKAQFERVYENAQVKLGIFSTEKGAIDWLAEQGFVADI